MAHTEYDVTLAQRVILNLATFSDPYEPIAADVNLNGVVANTDLIKMQQVIINSNYQFDQEWTFVPFHVYNGLTMPSTPTQVPTYSTVMQIGSNSSNTFYGIKYGDVDGSGSSCAQSFAAPVASKMIRMGKAQLQADKTVLIPVYGKQFQSEMLFSLGLQFDPSAIQVIGLKAGALPEFTEDCYAIGAEQSGLVNILWINTKNKTGVSVKPNEPLFYVQAKLLSSSTKISEKVISLNYDRVQNISINSGENFRKGEALGLEFEEAEGGANILSLPNEQSSKLKTGLHPNPFKNQLNLNLNSPIGGEAELRLMNQNGQLLYTAKLEVISGNNNISLGQLDAIPSGVVLYQLVLPGRVLSGKLIKE